MNTYFSLSFNCITSRNLSRNQYQHQPFNNNGWTLVLLVLTKQSVLSWKLRTCLLRHMLYKMNVIHCLKLNDIIILQFKWMVLLAQNSYNTNRCLIYLNNLDPYMLYSWTPMFSLFYCSAVELYVLWLSEPYLLERQNNYRVQCYCSSG